MSQRFTIDGSDALEERLGHYCAEAKAQVMEIIPHHLVEGIVLGGGYGRGEGGVLRSNEGEEPYNDLEFYVILKGSSILNQRKYAAALHDGGHNLSQEFGIEIEFKIISETKLRRSPVTMFYYDLVTGHRLIHGKESVLDGCDHHRAAHRIPLCEATRLMMNRCSGLLYSSERLGRRQFGSEESDFVGRNLAKLKLALGDTLLTAKGQYHWSCLERHKRLAKFGPASSIPYFPEIVRLHAEGVDFKLHPKRIVKSAGEFSSEFQTLSDIARDVWLWLESRRLSSNFRDPVEYALASINKCPENPAWKNLLVNLRWLGPRGLIDSDYPRSRLLNTLPLLLWEPKALMNSELRRFICLQLRANTASDFPSLVQSYQQIWQQFN